MLASEPVPVAIFDDEPEGPVPATGSAEALAAVERLTTLFAWAHAAIQYGNQERTLYRLAACLSRARGG
jgi:hypothetical protein